MATEYTHVGNDLLVVCSRRKLVMHTSSLALRMQRV